MAKSRLVWIDNARILAAFAVVLCHVTVYIPQPPDGSIYPGFLVAAAFDALVRWDVPVFVAISGALLLGSRREQPLADFYRRRFARVLLPTLVWSAVYLAMRHWAGYGVEGPLTPKLAVKLLLQGYPSSHLWFMYVIAGLYLVTPFLRRIVQHTTRRELAALIGLSLALAMAHAGYNVLAGAPPHFGLTWFLWFVPYFFVGHHVATHDIPASTGALVAVFFLSSVATWAGRLAAAAAWGVWLGNYFLCFCSVTVVPASLCAILLLKRLDRPLLGSAETNARIAGHTLGVYMVHPAILYAAVRVGLDIPALPAILVIPMVALILATVALGLVWGASRVPVLRRIL